MRHPEDIEETLPEVSSNPITEELRETIGAIVYEIHTDGRLQGKAAQDA